MTNDEWVLYQDGAADDDILERPTGTVAGLYNEDELLIDWDCGWRNYYHTHFRVERVAPELFAVQIGETSNVDEAIELATKVSQLLGLPAKVTHVQDR